LQVDKTRKALADESVTHSLRRQQATVEFIDCLTWQTAASVAVPGFAINRLVFFSGLLTKNLAYGPARRWLPTLIGLGAIPLIIHPIDHGVHYVMDNSVRKLYPVAASSARHT
jgi:fission process protein 1